MKLQAARVELLICHTLTMLATDGSSCAVRQLDVVESGVCVYVEDAVCTHHMRLCLSMVLPGNAVGIAVAL